MACHNCLFLRMYAWGFICTLRSVCLHHLFEYPLYRRINFFFPNLACRQAKRKKGILFTRLRKDLLLAIEQMCNVNAI